MGIHMNNKDRRCSRMERMMDPYLDGVLSKDDRAVLTQHIEQCPACRAELESRQALMKMLRETAPTAPKRDIFAAVWADPQVMKLTEERKLAASQAAADSTQKEEQSKRSKVWSVDLSRFVRVAAPIAAALVLVVGVTAALPIMRTMQGTLEMDDAMMREANMAPEAEQYMANGADRDGVLYHQAMSTADDSVTDAVETVKEATAPEADAPADSLKTEPAIDVEATTEDVSADSGVPYKTAPVTECPGTGESVSGGQTNPFMGMTSSGLYGYREWDSSAKNEVEEAAFDRYYRTAQAVIRTEKPLDVVGYTEVERFEDEMAVIVAYEYTPELQSYLTALAEQSEIAYELHTLREDGNFLLLCSYK